VPGLLEGGLDGLLDPVVGRVHRLDLLGQGDFLGPQEVVSRVDLLEQFVQVGQNVVARVLELDDLVLGVAAVRDAAQAESRLFAVLAVVFWLEVVFLAAAGF
jgi:hypothetical protein